MLCMCGDGLLTWLLPAVYRGLFCFAFFIMCGTIGYLGSSIFTKRIYRNIKCE